MICSGCIDLTKNSIFSLGVNIEAVCFNVHCDNVIDMGGFIKDKHKLCKSAEECIYRDREKKE